MDLFAVRLREIMTQLNITQSDLSRLTGLPKSAVSSYLSGQYRPKRKNLQRICLALGIPEDTLDCFSSQEQTENWDEQIRQDEEKIALQIKNRFGVKISEVVSYMDSMNEAGKMIVRNIAKDVSEAECYKKGE